MLKRLSALFAILGMTIACSTRPVYNEIAGSDVSDFCFSDKVIVDHNFPSSGHHSCSIEQDGQIVLSVRPESEPPINCSPWYAFRVTPRSPGSHAIKLNYDACGHRYRPKMSRNFVDWTLVSEDRVSVAEDRSSAVITLQLDDEPVYISAQEIFSVGTYALWFERLQPLPFVSIIDVGMSADGREIRGIAIGNPAAEKVVIVVGRQHPPEITGALALFPFVETLASEHLVAKQYREEVLTIVVPILNPDGVEGGHWRHNVRGVDLNRDWGPFLQPETRAMRDLIKRLVDGEGRHLQFLLDFHSTGRDVFYTLPEELATIPPDLSERWLERLEQRLPQFKVNRDPGHNAQLPVSKAFAYEVYKAPAVTFEIGDQTDRAMIVKVGQHSALAFMETILTEGK